MKIAEINKRIYAVPEKWNELTGRQFIAVMDILYGNYEAAAARLHLFRILLGVKWFRFLRIPLWEKAEFLYLTNFLITENDITRQVLPAYRGFYGPDSDFNNLTGDEFVFSEEFYFKCFTQVEAGGARMMEEEMLNELASVLYREKKKGYDTRVNTDGDPRQPFNQYVSSYNAKRKIKKWPISVKLAIFTWYESCRKNLIESNTEIFSGGAGEPARYGLISVMRVIAEGGIHGTFDQVQKMYVKMWMVELNEKSDEAKKNNPR